MRETCHEVLTFLKLENNPTFKLALKLEEIALQDEYFIEKKLYPNVDFYSGIVLKALGIPTSLFTVVFAMSRTIGWIANWKEMFETPGLLDRVRNDRSLIPKLIDEAVRYEPIATYKIRETSKDVEFYGVKIPKGSFVQCMVVSANRDEEVFENGQVFDIDRKARPSFGFGFGAHMCIGQFVAKMEIKCALNAMFDLFPNLRLDPDKPAPRIEGAQLRGASEVHVVWD